MHKEIKMMKIGAILPYQFKDEQGVDLVFKWAGSQPTPGLFGHFTK